MRGIFGETNAAAWSGERESQAGVDQQASLECEVAGDGLGAEVFEFSGGVGGDGVAVIANRPRILE